MCEIFALQGPADCGKTGVVKEISSLLIKCPNSQTLHLNHERGEVRGIIVINGKKVGIESEGDPYSRLEESLNYFMREKCDIIFCACRTRGMTVKWVNDQPAKKHFVPQKKVVSVSLRDQSNAAMAKKLINMVGL